MVLIRGTGTRKQLNHARIHRGKKIGQGREGIVHEAHMVLRRGSNTRTLSLVEKRITNWIDFLLSHKAGHSFAHLRNQFEVMEDIIAQNRTRKLGLNLPTTLLFETRPFRRDRLFSTKRTIHTGPMELGEQLEFIADRDRQIQILKKMGYGADVDSFKPIWDPKTNVFRAALIDFGTIKKK